MSGWTLGAALRPASLARAAQAVSTPTRFHSLAERNGWALLSPGRGTRSACLLFLFAACAPGPESGLAHPDVEQLSFVPKGWAEPFVGLRCEASEDLLVDRFEVTRERWTSWSERSEAPLADLSAWAPLDEGQNLPAVGMTYAEAQALAQARGMRLPTVGEWMFIAGGSRAQSWPQGNPRSDSVANTVEMGLGHTAAVGTFPAGASTATRVEDLIGNVWEWVSPPLPAEVEPMAWLLQGPSPYPLWAMGGSYQVRAQELFSFDGVRRFNAWGLEPEHRADDLGLRCVAGAHDYLKHHAQEWSQAAWEGRLKAIGKAWGRRAVPLLSRLVAEEGSAPALAWLLAGARE